MGAAGDIWTAYAVFVPLLVLVALRARRGSEMQRRALTLIILTTWLSVACVIGPSGWTAALIALWVLLALEHIDDDELARYVLVATWGLGPLALLELPFSGVWVWVLCFCFGLMAASLLVPVTPVRSGVYRWSFLVGFGLPALIAWRALGVLSPAWPIAVFLLLQLNDAFALVIGRWRGRRRIVSKVSPNKTLEGYVGGAIGLAVGTPIAAWLLGDTMGLSVGGWIVLGLALFVVANTGDLLFSWYKRRLGIKDFGDMLPGHGGLTDRFGNMLLAGVPLALWVL